MTRIAAQIAFLAALSPALLAAAAPQEPITLEQTSRGSGVAGVDLSVRLGTYSWGSDGEHVLLRRPGEDNVWIDPLTGERTEPVAPEEAVAVAGAGGGGGRGSATGGIKAQIARLDAASASAAAEEMRGKAACRRPAGRL